MRQILMEQPERGAAYYGGQLFDTAYNRELVPALRAGQLGSSFRFQVVRDEWVDRASRSDHNPDGLPERTILEARVFELGTVTFAAYSGATAGVAAASANPPRSAPAPRTMTHEAFMRILR